MAFKCPECDKVCKTIGGVRLHAYNVHGIKGVQAIEVQEQQETQQGQQQEQQQSDTCKECSNRLLNPSVPNEVYWIQQGYKVVCMKCLELA